MWVRINYINRLIYKFPYWISQEFISRKHLSEFGNMALVEQREEGEGGNVAIRLPGVRKGDMSSRRFQPEVRVFCVRFSPTGQAFAAAGTEGLCIYALDKGE